jgi:hypothetical protein
MTLDVIAATCAIELNFAMQNPFLEAGRTRAYNRAPSQPGPVSGRGTK